jgi:hypothetical protein
MPPPSLRLGLFGGKSLEVVSTRMETRGRRPQSGVLKWRDPPVGCGGSSRSVRGPLEGLKKGPSLRPSPGVLGEGENAGLDRSAAAAGKKIPGGDEIIVPAGDGDPFFNRRKGSPAPPDRHGPGFLNRRKLRQQRSDYIDPPPSVTSVASCAKLHSVDGSGTVGRDKFVE